jgi:hypothetical protein
MILNKFSQLFWNPRPRAFAVVAFAFLHFACNKSTGTNGNSAYINVIHTAYGAGPVKVTVKGDTLFANAIDYGQFTGLPGYPYDTIATGIENLELVSGSQVLLQGNSAFQQGARYSTFVYDTLDARSVKLLILQDNLNVRIDTFTYVRFMNFSPGTSLSFVLSNSRQQVIDSLGDRITIVDTIKTTYRPFVGYDPNPGNINYDFTLARIGKYKLQVTPDLIHFTTLDSVQIDSLKSYNLYLQGFFNDTSGVNKLQVKMMQLN